MPKVTRKGQVTIPQQIRAILKIQTGDEVFFTIDHDRIVLKKKKSSIENIRKYVGFLSHLKGEKPDDIIDKLRGTFDDCSG